jgi:hypothetical protein
MVSIKAISRKDAKNRIGQKAKSLDFHSKAFLGYIHTYLLTPPFKVGKKQSYEWALALMDTSSFAK